MCTGIESSNAMQISYLVFLSLSQESCERLQNVTQRLYFNFLPHLTHTSLKDDNVPSLFPTSKSMNLLSRVGMIGQTTPGGFRHSLEQAGSFQDLRPHQHHYRPHHHHRPHNYINNHHHRHMKKYPDPECSGLSRSCWPRKDAD